MKTVEDLNLGTRINNALNIFYSQHDRSIKTVPAAELAQWSPTSFLRLRALGRHSVHKIIDSLEAAGYPCVMRYELDDMQRELDVLIRASKDNTKRLMKFSTTVNELLKRVGNEIRSTGREKIEQES